MDYGYEVRRVSWSDRSVTISKPVFVPVGQLVLGGAFQIRDHFTASWGLKWPHALNL